jgi:hypothetical protein
VETRGLIARTKSTARMNIDWTVGKQKRRLSRHLYEFWLGTGGPIIVSVRIGPVRSR